MTSKKNKGKGVYLDSVPTEIHQHIEDHQEAFKKRYPSKKCPNKHQIILMMLQGASLGTLKRKTQKFIKEFKDYNK